MAGKKSFGVVVTLGSTVIGGLTEVSFSGGDVNFVDITTHSSAGGWKEFVGGLSDGGTVELTGACDLADSGQAALITERAETVSVTVTLSDGSSATFDAVVGVYQVSNPQDDKIEFTCSLKVTGEIDYTAASA
jgi:predicted secreted protein